MARTRPGYPSDWCDYCTYTAQFEVINERHRELRKRACAHHLTRAVRNIELSKGDVNLIRRWPVTN